MDGEPPATIHKRVGQGLDNHTQSARSRSWRPEGSLSPGGAGGGAEEVAPHPGPQLCTGTIAIIQQQNLQDI